MATGDTMHVEVVTAERDLYSGDANAVNAPGSEGRLGILHIMPLCWLFLKLVSYELNFKELKIFSSSRAASLKSTKIPSPSSPMRQSTPTRSIEPVLKKPAVALKNASPR